MEYNRSIIVGAGFKDPKGNFFNGQHFFAEVVLIDNTNQALSPILFQLNNEALLKPSDLAEMPKDLITIPKDAFMMVGEVVSIDKQKKMIHLSDNHTVSYNYLILAQGQKYSGGSQTEEFLIGLHTLIDALKIKKISTNFSEWQSSYSNTKIASYSTFDISTHCLPKDILNAIAQTKNEHLPNLLNCAKKCFFEVVI